MAIKNAILGVESTLILILVNVYWNLLQSCVIILKIIKTLNLVALEVIST